MLRYRHNGKPREFTLTADAMADDYRLKAARDERDELRKRIREKEDIALTKRLGDPSNLSTFSDLADEWYFRNIKPNVQNPQIIRLVLDKDIPLVPPVIEWLKALKVFAAGSEWLLPKRRIAKRSIKPHISPDTLNVALKRAEHGLDHFTIHDLRRTARSRLSELGVSREVAERALNHKLQGIAGVYDHHDYFEERKQALTLWADLLVSLDKVKDYNVIPFTNRV